jgi:hypothetical protein
MDYNARIVMPSWRWCVLGLLLCCAGCHCGPTHPPTTSFYNPYTLLPCQCKARVPYELCSADSCHGLHFTQWRTWSEYCQPCAPCAARKAVAKPTDAGAVAPQSPQSTLDLVPTPEEAPREPLPPKVEVKPQVRTLEPPPKAAVEPSPKPETRISVPGSAPAGVAPADKSEKKDKSPADTQPQTKPDDAKKSAANDVSEVHVLVPPPRRQEPALTQPTTRVTELQPDLPSHLLLLRHLF